jgi:hypothetical protein
MLYNPCLLEEVDSLAFKILLSPIGIGKKNFFINLKCYDLTNGKE